LENFRLVLLAHEGDKEPSGIFSQGPVMKRVRVGRELLAENTGEYCRDKFMQLKCVPLVNIQRVGIAWLYLTDFSSDIAGL